MNTQARAFVFGMKETGYGVEEIERLRQESVV